MNLPFDVVPGRDLLQSFTEELRIVLEIINESLKKEGEERYLLIE